MDEPVAHGGTAEGEVVWEPSPELVATSGHTRFVRWLAEQRGRTFGSYDELWRWSVEDLEGFWAAVWDYVDVPCARSYDTVLEHPSMPGTRWFRGARLNYADVCLPDTAPATAIVAVREDGLERTLTAEQLRAQVASVATALAGLGVRPGDRVAGVVPNCPEAVVALLATASIGAVWTSCAPEHGPHAILDRFVPVEPVVLVAVDGYVFGGRRHHMSDVVGRVQTALPSVRHRVVIPYLGDAVPEGCVGWETLLEAPPSTPPTPVDAEHPLWILFSSGTTGPPKAIVHGHAGIVVEQLKSQLVHTDLGGPAPCRQLTLASTTWVIWNIMVSNLLSGTTLVLYDGSPSHPGPEAVWALVARHAGHDMRVSAAWVQLCRRSGVRPADHGDLAALRMVTVTGSALSPAGTRWLVDELGPGVCPVSTSGGTDVGSGFVGAVTTRPVRAGEIQSRLLGVAAHAFDDDGRAVVDQVGELVVTQPMPSMPLGLWGDDDGSLLRATYFDHFPGVWRHGDWARFTPDGACVISGRSDATLNRGGVRMGTAEFHRVLDPLPEIVDALVVDTGLAGNDGELLLFVALAPGIELDGALDGRLRLLLRRELSPRHVPDRIVAVPAVPYTTTGKRCEVPVKRVLQGASVDEAARRSALRNPDALDWFATFVWG